MRRLFVFVLLAVTAASAINPASWLFDEPHFTWGGKLGYQDAFSVGDEDYPGAFTGGLRFAGVLFPMADLGLCLDYAVPDGRTLVPLYLQARLRLPWRLTPYLSLGGGMILDGGSERAVDWLVNYGGGLEFGFGGLLGVYVDALWQRNDDLDYVVFSLGFFSPFW